jgi:hypothetical protein
MSTVIDFDALRRKAWTFWDDDCLYPLGSESWWTGLDAAGRQLLVTFDRTHARVARFDADGRPLEVEVAAHGLQEQKLEHFYKEEAPAFHEFLCEHFGYREGVIKVRRFESRELGVSIRPLPSWYMRFLDTPENYPETDRQEFTASIERWIAERHTWVFKWGNEYFIDWATGECTSS